MGTSQPCACPYKSNDLPPQKSKLLCSKKLRSSVFIKSLRIRECPSLDRELRRILSFICSFSKEVASNGCNDSITTMAPKPSEQQFAQLVKEQKSTIYTVCYMFSKDAATRAHGSTA